MVLGSANFFQYYNGSPLDKKEVFKILEYFEKNNGDIIDSAYNYFNSKLLYEYGWKKKIITKIWKKEELSKVLDDLKTNRIYCCMARENDPELLSYLRELQQQGIIEKTGLSCFLPYELNRSYYNVFSIPCDPLWFKNLNIMTLYADVYLRSFYNLFTKHYDISLLENIIKNDINNKIDFIVGVRSLEQLKENIVYFERLLETKNELV